jgi:hypothetical protein
LRVGSLEEDREEIIIVDGGREGKNTDINILVT